MVELESDGEMTRSEVASFLREFAAELDDGSIDRSQRRTSEESQEEIADGVPAEAERITFIVGGESATVTLPNTVDFDIEVESRSPLLSSGVNQAITFDLSWEIEDQEGELGSDRIEIE